MRARHSEKNRATGWLPTYRKILYRYKILFYAAFSMLLLVLPAMAKAQGVPDCGSDDDPFDQCPIDTWVWVLVGVALIFVTIHLYRKQKKLLNITY